MGVFRPHGSADRSDLGIFGVRFFGPSPEVRADLGFLLPWDPALLLSQSAGS